MINTDFGLFFFFLAKSWAVFAANFFVVEYCLGLVSGLCLASLYSVFTKRKARKDV